MVPLVKPHRQAKENGINHQNDPAQKRTLLNGFSVLAGVFMYSSEPSSRFFGVLV